MKTRLDDLGAIERQLGWYERRVLNLIFVSGLLAMILGPQVVISMRRRHLSRALATLVVFLLLGGLWFGLGLARRLTED